MFKKIIILFACILALSQSAFSQESEPSDFGTWTFLHLNKSIGAKSYAFARAELRTFNDASATETSFYIIGAGYKFTKWFGANLGYEYWDLTGYSSKTDKVTLTCTASASKEGLGASWRQKFEYTMPRGGSTHLTWRSLLRAQYKIPGGTGLTPYMAYEIFASKKWERSLYYTGCEKSFGKFGSLDLFYMFHIVPSLYTEHVAGLGYIYSF